MPCHGLVDLSIGAVLVAIVLKWGSLPFQGWSPSPLNSKIFAFYILGFSLLWVIGVLYTNYHQYSTFAKAQIKGTAQVIEGTVTDFGAMPVTGRAIEHFCVSNACFDYSDYLVTSGFNQTRSHGGPIHEGLPVRITYVGNAII